VKIDGATILVTGANGFVGSRTAAHLREHGATVRALVRRAGEMPALLRDGIEEVEGDFTDEGDAERAVDGVDAVVHCAATAGPDLEAVRRVNRDGTRVIARAALHAGVDRFVHISTMSVYARGESAVIDEDVSRVDEGDPYSLTKAEAEREVEAAAADGLHTTILRPPAVLGWSPTSTWGQKMPERIRSGELPARGEKTTFAWVHVDDLAAAARLALTAPNSGDGVYNVSGGDTTWGRYVRDVASWFEDAAQPELTDGADWTGRTSSERIERELGWAANFSYEDGMSEARRHWQSEIA
jgi:nucleoside-diphosphate-sugar epimerase